MEIMIRSGSSLFAKEMTEVEGTEGAIFRTEYPLLIRTQQNQCGSNYSSASNNTNMSEFPTRTTPGNITNTTAAENIILTPAK